MEVNYGIEYAASIKKDIASLATSAAKTIRSAIETRLTDQPLIHGKPLQRSWKGHRRLRVGHYRVIYRINENEKVVFIVAIGHRKDIYDE